MTAALATQGLGFRAGPTSLLEGVTLEVEAGEILAVVGPNGAGKSTLVRLLAGDLKPVSGTITLMGQDLAGQRPGELSRLRAVLPQQTVVQFPFTARDIVMMGRHPHQADAANSRKRDADVVDSVMQATDTQDLQRRIFPSLSAGEQARVALARILAQETPVILLDEPTAALDVHHQERAMMTLRRQAAADTAVIAVLHDLNLAAAYANRIALIADGQLAALGDPASVLQEELLSATYRQPMRVVDHPHRACPLVLVE